MSSLICGSVAYDTIMTFPGHFKDQILPDQLHILNVSFFVPSMRREFGGCAGNIAYTLKLLGGEPLIMATIGQDGGTYLQRLAQLAISDQYIRQIDAEFTAQAMITTDLANNQITAFHPGAMMHSHLNQVADVTTKPAYGIVAPDGRDGMVNHAQQFAEANIPFIFDPGQGLPMFNGEELKHFAELASFVIVNDYEAQMMLDRTGLTIHQLADIAGVLIVTKGEAGSDIYSANEKLELAVIQPEAIVDPTGCGDAYRAALLFGLENGYDLATTGRLANLIGAIKIAHRGGQNHVFDFEGICVKFKESYGYSLA